MNSKRGKARKLATTLGLALAAVLALSAITAGAAQAANFRIEGKTLTELGFKGEEVETVSSSGLLNFKLVAWGSNAQFVNCEETGSGNIARGGRFGQSMTLSGCELKNSSTCDLKPFTMIWTGAIFTKSPSGFWRVAQVNGGSELLAQIQSNNECFWGSSFNMIESEGPLEFGFGPESTNLSITVAGTRGHVSESPVEWSGSMTWSLTGKNAGKKFTFY
jgi:hypothetical protein